MTGSLAMIDFDTAAQTRLGGCFAEFFCRVDSEKKLFAIHEKTSQERLELHLIMDSGKTEFHGVPTNTCLAIGPEEASRIDA